MVQRTKESVLEAIKGSLGIMSTIAKRLDCESRTAKRLINKWQETRDALEDEGDRVLDIAETGLYDQLIKKEQWAIKFILATKGQERGYIQIPTVKIDNGDPLNIKFDGMTRQEIENADNIEIGGMNESSATE